MGSSNEVAAYFRRKAMIQREQAANARTPRESMLHGELAELYDQRATDAERDDD